MNDEGSRELFIHILREECEKKKLPEKLFPLHEWTFAVSTKTLSTKVESTFVLNFIHDIIKLMKLLSLIKARKNRLFAPHEWREKKVFQHIFLQWLKKLLKIKPENENHHS